MTPRGTNAAPVWRVVLFGLVMTVPMAVLTMSIAEGYLVEEIPTDVVALAAYGGLGGLVIFRRDGNAVGWLLLALGATVISTSRAAGLPILSQELGAWLNGAGWSFVFGLFTALTLVFPSGHLPTADHLWSRIGRLAGHWLLPLVVLTSAFSSGDSPQSNLNFLPGWLFFPSYAVLVLTLIGGATSLVIRRRHSRGLERAQLGWVVLPLALLATSILVTVIVVMVPQALGRETPGDDAWIVVYLSIITFPVFFGVAVLRYRLYDIDRIISRTVSYGLVTAVLVAVYLGAVFILGSLPPLEGELAVAGSTLLAAALFSPLRRRIQNAVDRRFNRSRFDAQLTMEALSRRLATEVDLTALSLELEHVALQTLQPADVQVWVRGIRG
jgi:hypothetical protein